jgi:hypothetical protein
MPLPSWLGFSMSDAQLPHAADGLGGKGLVQLDQIDVADAHPVSRKTLRTAGTGPNPM